MTDLEAVTRVLTVALDAARHQSDPGTRAAMLALLTDAPDRVSITFEVEDGVGRFTVVVAGLELCQVDARTIGMHWVAGEVVLLDFDPDELTPVVIPDDLSGL